jgi:hypothetical protein
MEYQKDKIMAQAQGFEGQRGATTVLPLRNNNNTEVLSIVKYATTPAKVIQAHIPKTPGIRSSFCYLILLLICAHPRHTIGYYNDSLGTTHEVVRKAVRYLLRLNYVKEVRSPRLIIPMNVYMVDTCYILTPSGRKVIQRLLEY